MSVISGRSSFRLQCLPQSDFPELSAGSFSHIFRIEFGGAEGPDRQDAVRHLDRGNALLSERHLFPRHRDRRQAEAALGGDRRPPARARRNGRARRLRRHAGHHHPAQDGQRIAEAGRRSRRGGDDRAFGHQDPLHHRQRRADLEADRRHLPGLSARHPDRQRQEAHHRPPELCRAPSTASRRSRRSAAAR